MGRKIATRPPLPPPPPPPGITSEQPAGEDTIMQCNTLTLVEPLIEITDGLNDFEKAVQGDGVLYEFFGNRVVESIAFNGRVVAVKVKEKNRYLHSEARMMSYASH